MSNLPRTTKGWVAAGVAFASCPCHLPLIMPIFLTMIAGTAIGGWLAGHQAGIYIIASILFIASLVLAGKWLITGQVNSCPIELDDKQSVSSNL